MHANESRQDTSAKEKHSRQKCGFCLKIRQPIAGASPNNGDLFHTHGASDKNHGRRCLEWAPRQWDRLQLVKCRELTPFQTHRAGGVEVGGSVLEAGLHVPAVVTGVRVVGSACLRRGGVEPVGSVVVRKARELLRARCGRSLRHAAVVKVEGRLHALHEQQQHDAHLHPPR